MDRPTKNLMVELEKKIFSLAKGLDIVSGGILAIMMFLATLDVVLRYIFHRPLLGTMELIEVMLALIAALSYAYAETNREHISIDFLTSKLPQKINASLETITDLLGLEMLLLISLRLFNHAQVMKTSGLITPSLQIPIYPFLYAVSFGWIIFTLVKFINIVKSAKEKSAQFWIGIIIGGVILLLCLLIPTIRGSDIQLSRSMVGLIGIIILLILTFTGMSMGMVMSIVGFLGMVYIMGLPSALNVIGITPYSTTATYNYSVYPLFILMGSICFFAGLGEDIFKAVHKWFGHLSGGLAIATVVASAFFAAVSGSGTANAATMGKVALPEMKKLKYNAKLSSGSIAAGGTIGVLIPPSTVFVLYGILTQQPIGKLFISGILPGILKTLIYTVVITFLCKKHPDWGPRAPEKADFKERVSSLKYIWSVVILFILVMGGLYTGVFTPSEAAGIGAFGAFVCAILRGGFSSKKFFDSCLDTSKTVGALFFILIGAMLLGTFLTVTRVPFQLADYVSALAVNRYIIIFILVVVFLICGSIMDIFSVTVIIVPIVFPIITSLGFDPIWFGVLITWLFEIGALTPPIGINVFVLKSVAKDIPIEDIFRGVGPFYLADMLAIFLLIGFPQIATFLPSLVR